MHPATRAQNGASRAQKGAARALKKSDSTHAGTTRRGKSTTRGATRGKERANSPRRLVRDAGLHNTAAFQQYLE